MVLSSRSFDAGVLTRPLMTWCESYWTKGLTTPPAGASMLVILYDIILSYKRPITLMPYGWKLKGSHDGRAKLPAEEGGGC